MHGRLSTSRHHDRRLHRIQLVNDLEANRAGPDYGLEFRRVELVEFVDGRHQDVVREVALLSIGQQRRVGAWAILGEFSVPL